MRAEHDTVMSSRPGTGWTAKRTLGLAAGPKGSMSKACSAEVRAPVSILALRAGRPRSGNASHSSQPRRKGMSSMGAPWHPGLGAYSGAF